MQRSNIIVRRMENRVGESIKKRGQIFNRFNNKIINLTFVLSGNGTLCKWFLSRNGITLDFLHFERIVRVIFHVSRISYFSGNVRPALSNCEYDEQKIVRLQRFMRFAERWQLTKIILGAERKYDLFACPWQISRSVQILAVFVSYSMLNFFFFFASNKLM